MIGIFRPLIKVTPILFCLLIISPGARVTSASLETNPIGLNFPVLACWNLKSLFASKEVNGLLFLNFLFIVLNDLGNFSTLTSLKTNIWGLLALN